MTTVIDHAERAHSELGASGAHRWAKCPASIRLARGLPSESNRAADEGTAYHELSERCLRDGSDAMDHLGEILTVRNQGFEVDEESAEHLQLYLDVVRTHYRPELGDVLSVEERFDLSAHVMDGMFGTADVVIYQPRNQRLIVIDLKFGKNYAVEAKGSLQLRYYALGALLKGNYPVDDVHMIIVQPRAPHKDGPVRDEIVDVMELLDFKSELKAAAEATLAPDCVASAGPWCQFCRVEGTCEARRTKAVADAKLEFMSAPLEELDGEELALIMAEAKSIKSWVKAVEQEALRRLAAGLPVTGQKLVTKRAVRKWCADEAIVAEAIINATGASDDDIWVKKLHSPRQMELRLKAHKKALADFVVKVSSGLTIAPESDRRDAVIPQAGAVLDFGSAAEDED